ncbi:HNH endonuclease [Pantoea sp. X85]|uniref:HNH endonuclease n=1 Tax=Pantoea sp. X85 TaxID=3037258 RepID=UPI0024136B7A|nr:HNH endonuclease [Pantoea sp. X85]WFL66414.1 HNH endonuclease [Pantoea sp. X85]
MPISQQDLHNLFNFDPKTGLLTWKVSPGIQSHVCIGDIAGSMSGDGYWQIKIKGRVYKAHRLAWLFVHGVMPPMIDHINGIRSDNRMGNLRACDLFSNMWNMKRSVRNKSGVKGVSWNSQISKWKAQITIRKKCIHLGYYEDLELASLVASEAREKLHNNFTRHD